MSLAIFKKLFSTSLIRERPGSFIQKPSFGRMAYGDRNHWSRSFRTSVRKTGRGPDSLQRVVNQLGPGAMAASKEEAAACEMVLLAVPWDNVPETLASLREWSNRILIDGTNPFHGKAGKFTLADVGNLSTSQFIAALTPGARVVKALNTMIVPKLEADPIVNGARRVVFISADDEGAEKQVRDLTRRFRPFSH
jgi:8-hydroxy-5-deazaflavin:NADPH oxidoreductase